MLLKCPNCGAPHRDGISFCPSCGARLASLNGPDAQRGSKLSLSKIAGYVFLALLGFGWLLHILNSDRISEPANNYRVPSAEQEHAALVKELDPIPPEQMNSQDNFKTASILADRVDPKDYNKANILISGALAHNQAALKDSKFKTSAVTLNKRLAKLSVKAMEYHVWQSDDAEITSKVMCKMVIENALKAPASADWVDSNVGRWRGHPGYFLVDHTVDAENSFGAKLRTMYECQVYCLSDSNCSVNEVYEAER